MNPASKILLKEALRRPIPGTESHRRLLPFGRRIHEETEMFQSKMSSVLLLVYPDSDRLFVCLTKRPTTMKHHPGQISFPGGKVEKDDLSAEMTALREAYEEIGIAPKSVEILGKLSDLFVEVSGFTIQPFLGWMNSKPNFRVDQGEVEQLILFPLSEFVENELIHHTILETSRGFLEVKYYPFQGEIIWGATAMIMAELIDILREINRRTTSSIQT